MKYTAFFILFFVIALHSQAQDARVTGRIVDAISGEALEYSSVALYTLNDSGLVTGTITKSSGHFELKDVHPGSYFIKAHFMGYQTRQSESFSLSNGQRLDLGIIEIEPARELINEVTVSGNRINAVNKIDRQAYSAAQFEAARGGNAVDVLRNMPSVAVNAQGDISVRGSSGFQVLINGKPVLSDAQTVLSQLPANVVDRVELITSPSAKFDPDGKAGIINITTKKGAANGSGLRINALYGLPSTTDYGNDRVAKRHGVDMTGYYRRNKWDVSLGGNYNRNDIAGYRVGNVIIRNPENNTENRFPSEGERSFNRYNYAARAAISFTPDSANSFTFGIFTGKRYQERDANIFYTNSQWTLGSEEKIYDAPYYNANKQIKQGTFTLGNLDYTHIFTGGSSVTASFLYEYDDLYGNTFNRNLSAPGGENFQFVRNPYQKPIRGYRTKLDYAIDIWGGEFLSGYQYRNDELDGEFDYFVSPDSQNQLDEDLFRGKVVSVNRIHSVYSQFSASKEKLEYIAGLRYEYAMRTVDLSIDPETHTLNLSNFFPSFNLLYSISDQLQLKAGMSRRIQRSNNNQLNPIPEREHSETLEMGDPDILPEYINLYEIGLTKNFGSAGTLFGTMYYQASRNPVQRVNSIYNDTILNRVYTNVERARAIGFETGADLHPLRWWSLYMGANLFHQEYFGDLVILNNPAIPVNNTGWVYSLNANSTFRFSPTFSLQATVNYLSKRPTAQGEDSRFLSPHLTLKKQFLDNRLTASIQWQYIDLGMEESNRQRITTRGKNFYTTTNYIYETDFIMLNISYNLNFNNDKVKLPSSEFGEKEF